MNKKSTKVFASAALVSLVLSTALSCGSVKAAAGKVTRIGEVDRYATAAKAAEANWTNSDNVVLVSGEGYADAISAAALAKKLNAPILLTNQGELNTNTESALSALKTENIYIVGGKAAVSQAVRDALKTKYRLIELGGANRYETNAAVAEKLVELGANPGNVMMVGGEGFSDAISVSPIAAAKEKILLIGNNNRDSMKSIFNFVNKNKSKVTVVASKSAISDKILNSANGTRVEGGKDRWDTNLKVLSAFKDNIKADKLYIASSSCSEKDDGYADALVASALAGKTASPLVLVDKEGTEGTTNAVSYIKNNLNKASELNIVGGTGAVSKATEDSINNAVTGQTTGQAIVDSIEGNGLNQFTVHFDTAVDSDSAENVTNYKVNGTELTSADMYGKAADENSAVATEIDSKTILVTLAKPRTQLDNVKISVEKNILTSDKKNVIAAFEQNVAFSDTEAPKLKSVTAQGNHQITVEFSGAVNMKDINNVKNKFKIDGQNISSYGMSSDSNLTKVKTPMIIGDKNWSRKVVFYFDSKITSGKHTLKISDGDENGLLSDAAGYVFKEASQDFTIDSNATPPAIKSVKETANGEVAITFDRSMDLKTAKYNKSNYEINGKKISDIKGASVTTSSNDTIVKLKYITDGTIQSGSNVVYISNNVKDAYGNKVTDDTRVNFQHVKDETKPTVSKVTVIDSETIRVQFSENVNYAYVTNTSNYKLEDSKGIDITNHIDGIYNSKIKTTKTNADIYDIKLKKTNPQDPKDDWRLTGSKYNLTIKNIIDTESNSNMMDDYTTTLTGIDDAAPKITGIYYKQNSSKEKDEAVVYFSEAMDTETLTNKDNYRFLDGEGDSKELPEGAVISAGGDNKSVTIEFPSNYKIKTCNAGGNIANTGESSDVLKVLASNIKDEAGNVLDGGSYSGGICVNSSGSQVMANTIKLYYDGDDLKADIHFNKAVDNLTASDFTLGKVAPTSASVSADKVTLTFADGDLATDYEKTTAAAISFGNGKVNKDGNTTKIDLIKAQGQKAYLGIKANAKTTDETGSAIASLGDTSGNSQNTIYDYESAPKTAPDYWTAVKDENGGKVYLTFDTVLYENSAKSDDFMFTAADGTNLKADSASVNGNTIVFTFNKDNKNIASFSNKIMARAKSTVSIIADRDADGNYAKYVPTSDDLKDRTVNVITQ